MEREEAGPSAAEKAKQETEAREEATDQVRRMEEEGDPPSNLEDWPSGKAKYITYGGPEGDHGYDEGPEQELGPSELRRHEDGSVTIGGEQVDDPEAYKGDPIPGGPTDPDAPETPMERRREEMKND